MPVVKFSINKHCLEISFMVIFFFRNDFVLRTSQRKHLKGTASSSNNYSVLTSYVLTKTLMLQRLSGSDIDCFRMSCGFTKTSC